MKNTLFLGLLITISLSLMSTSCSDDDDGTMNNNDQQIEQIRENMISGTWSITSFIDSGQDETNDFNGYGFTFAQNGTLTAQNGTTTLTGTWSVTDSDSSDDDDNDDVDFNIFFPVDESSDFEDLNDDWDVTSYTSTTLNLIDISGGNGGTDTLTFEKN